MDAGHEVEAFRVAAFQVVQSMITRTDEFGAIQRLFGGGVAQDVDRVGRKFAVVVDLQDSIARLGQRQLDFAPVHTRLYGERRTGGI
jgi:hypothetical protein